jgi:hypothetical protein
MLFSILNFCEMVSPTHQQLWRRTKKSIAIKSTKIFSSYIDNSQGNEIYRIILHNVYSKRTWDVLFLCPYSSLFLCLFNFQWKLFSRILGEKKCQSCCFRWIRRSFSLFSPLRNFSRSEIVWGERTFNNRNIVIITMMWWHTLWKRGVY